METPGGRRNRQKLLDFNQDGHQDRDQDGNGFRMRIPHWFLFLVLAVPFLGMAQGTSFTYQGRLLENGQAANGIYDVQIALMDAPINGNQLGPLFNNVSTVVSNGVLMARLDFGDGV